MDADASMGLKDSALLPVWLVGLILVIIPVWRILRRAGLQPALSLMLIIPLFGWLVVAVTLAFRDWPALRQAARERVASTFE